MNIERITWNSATVVRPEIIVYKRGPKASWRSGYAADCKSVHPGSIPGEASTNSVA